MVSSVMVAVETTCTVESMSQRQEPIHLFDDERLVTACLAGDEEAWVTLLNRYHRLIYTIPLRFGFTQFVAEEVFQEVCLTLLEKLATLREHRRFSAWLVTVTRRVCLQRMRDQKEVPSLNGAEDALAAPHTPEAAFLLLEEQMMVHGALAKLDDRCQHLLRALFFETASPSYAEIARTLQMPEGSIGPTRIRCLEKLRHLLLEESTNTNSNHG